MLNKIDIENFLTIEKLTIKPSQKITAIVGESGSGKSLILKAINFVFSQKTDTTLVGNFSELTKISLTFTLNALQKETLSEFGITDPEIVITKIIKRGSSKVFINHEPITAKAIASFKPILISIVSQEYKFELFSSDKLLELIDTHVERKTKENFEQSFNTYIQLKKSIENIQERVSQIDNLHPELLLETIEKVNPKRGEYEELLEKLNRIKNLKTIKDIANRTVFELYEKENSCEEVLNKLIKELEKLSSLSLETNALMPLQEALELIRQPKDELYTLINSNFSDEDIDEINSRLFQLEKLKRQFGREIDEIIEKREELKKLLSEREQLLFQMRELQEKLKIEEQIVLKAAEELSRERKKIAKAVEKSVIKYLSELRLEKSVVRVVFKQKQLSKSGFDSVDILFSANPDIEPYTLDKVASGGEKSRFILALKMTLSELSKSGETVVFDEIESGLSAEALNKLLKLLALYSERNQLILITHSEEVSENAEIVYRVEKEFEKGRTLSKVKRIK